jgi:hypothetical protein
MSFPDDGLRPDNVVRDDIPPTLEFAANVPSRPI